MQNLDTLLFSEDLTAEQRAMLRDALAKDPALAEAFAHWQQICSALRERLPDRQLLVLYTLDATGHAEVLSADERSMLEAARITIEEAVRTQPGLADVVQDIAGCCDDFEAAWDAHLGSTEQLVHTRAVDRAAARPRRTRPVSRWGWRVAAAAAVVIFVGILALLVQRDASQIVIQVAENETQLIELADGSTVRLLGGSNLTYSDPDREAVFNRRVALTGQAFFEIISGQQGFTVETPTGVTTVLGTSFGIKADAESMEVVLATGKIAVASTAAPDRIVVLEPGQRSRVARNAMPSTPAAVDLPEALAWTGLFVFRATPLEEAVMRLGARYGTTITIAPGLEAEAITGTFAQDEPLAAILETLATALNATVHAEADGYAIAPR